MAREVLYKLMPNGNIRGYIDTPDKRGVSECQYQNPNNIAMTITTAHIPKILSYTRDRKKGKILNYHTKEIANTLHSSTGGGGNTDQYVLNTTADGMCPTFCTVYGKMSKTNFLHHSNDGRKAPAVVNNYRVRKLTERECFRLMGVDDKDIDKIQSVGICKTQQYKMAGNSIVVDVLYHIFRQAFSDINLTQNNMATKKQLEALRKGRAALAAKRKTNTCGKKKTQSLRGFNEPREHLKVTLNHSNHTATIRKYDKSGKLFAKYRTYRMRPDDWRYYSSYATERDWYQWLKTNEYYVVK